MFSCTHEQLKLVKENCWKKNLFIVHTSKESYQGTCQGKLGRLCGALESRDVLSLEISILSRSKTSNCVDPMIEWKNHPEKYRDRFFFYVPECSMVRSEKAHIFKIFKGTVRRRNIFYTISILFRSTRKYSVLTKSISHHVPEIFRFL